MYKLKGLLYLTGVTGGPLTHNYKLVQFHFHWGKTNKSGSEHRIDGAMFPAEVKIKAILS